MNLPPANGLISVKPAQGGRETTIALVGRISRRDIPGLCERARELLQTGTSVLVCDATGLSDPDAVSVDVIARLQLFACRTGGELLLRNACPELRELLDLAGLSDVIPIAAD